MRISEKNSAKRSRYLSATILSSILLVAAAAPSLADTITVKRGKMLPGGYAPKFAVIHRTHLDEAAVAARAGSLPPTWVESYTYSGKAYNETFIGTTASGGASTTVPVYIIPIKMVYSTTSEDPTVITQNGVSIIQNVVNSPVFASSVTYTQGTAALGTTQYLDAFQRGNLWGTVSSHTGYHVLLGAPTIEPVQTLTVPKKSGTTATVFGVTAIIANINWYDPAIQALITTLKIPSNALPLFITTDTYLSSNNGTSGCCIGGYHTVASSGQPYASSSYIPVSGAFAQDVGALSHEIGEWIDDPNTNNPVPSKCGSGAVLEVGDPLEGNTNYGDYTYTVAGVAWHMQDLVFLPYFGAPTSTSANGWSTFQGETIAFCSKGG